MKYNAVDLVLGVISVVSFLLAVWQLYLSERRKDREKANLAVVRQKMDSAADSLEAAFATVNAAIQIPKRRKVSVEEFQDLARIARIQVLTSVKALRESGDLIKSWRSGEILKELTDEGSGIESTDPPAPKERIANA
ncbi:hypothetical protein ABZU53_05050 [Micromonospora sp. NPDC005194]|uniref:hypothetical protein n=1 Tax=Micromonospora sp. NPDC005194 TaxID=3156870 RepID=UPI0033B7994D